MSSAHPHTHFGIPDMTQRSDLYHGRRVSESLLSDKWFVGSQPLNPGGGRTPYVPSFSFRDQNSSFRDFSSIFLNIPPVEVSQWTKDTLGDIPRILHGHVHALMNVYTVHWYKFERLKSRRDRVNSHATSGTMPSFLGNVKDMFSLVDQNALTTQFQERAKQLQMQLISDALGFQIAQLDEAIPFYETMFQDFDTLAISSLKVTINGLYARYGTGTGLNASLPNKCYALLKSGVERFLQAQTFKRYSSDQKAEAKLQKRNQQDMLMNEASSVSTKETIEALVNEAMKPALYTICSSEIGSLFSRQFLVPRPSARNSTLVYV
ncbi:hypothetical protein POJ06DRAFT_141422 [Lipomyces tetrasporus]|uniref:Uncharacterized protein n=1 Tax=Lipomyces tetrasporus TaxID=54092 RepID=A0AAD7VRC7_9ASCO|nr:uncharacterized protein POJ06DRAFT_141422 [Lipomyces tetrasporus]KAJ8098756.1 hypothetical protein POJ06DRAFT_141422 [Lipomyces tetrasporus]